ncbi:SRPBCC family protein [Micrococcus porci]|uniref:SRPBCC family protein n=1 Tax=Micrococcus porci TaxID=2856555 RepID=UPI001CCCF663|nr:SRPBCC family protein [Micrococcus porci]UBH25498.1 SRPBCC family protein [Micrococcus porci]
MWTPRKLQARGAAAARQGDVDAAAPVSATAQIDTAASASALWGVLADVDSWPGVVPGVTSAQVASPTPLSPGHRFTWANGGTTIRSRVEVVRPGHDLTWTGIALWLVAVHRNVIETLPDGQARLTSTESMAGVAAALLMPEEKLQQQLQAFVEAIAAEAERRSR